MKLSEKILSIFIAAIVCCSAVAAEITQQRTIIASGITTASPTYTDVYTFPKGNASRVYSATVAGSGAVTATVVIYGSNEGAGCSSASGRVTLGTITLSGSTAVSDGFVSPAPWPFVCGAVTAISGTSATVTIAAGI